MKKFLLLVRGNYPDTPLAEDVLEDMKREWGAWYETLKAANSLVDPGNPVSHAGKLVSTDAIQDGAVKSNDEWVGGYIFVQAEDMDGAVKIAQTCPAMKDSKIEVREVINMM